MFHLKNSFKNKIINKNFSVFHIFFLALKMYSCYELSIFLLFDLKIILKMSGVWH